MLTRSTTKGPRRPLTRPWNVGVLHSLSDYTSHSLSLIRRTWTLWRPLPTTTGTILAVTSDRVTIRRDSLGVPHIEANNLEDVFFAQGFVTAQDRLWQMDATRRAASGELAEIVGPAALENDRDVRRMRMRRLAEQQELQLEPAERQV